MSIIIRYKEKNFIGNCKKILLEQLEFNNMDIPNLCRIGVCGLCKLKLLKGTILYLRNKIDVKVPWILTCSCVPKSNIFLI